MASPSSIPNLPRTASNFSDPKILIKSSSKDKKNADLPGSPWRPDLPRN